ncbi:hypothetical protein HII36_07060 [Nonomuraea sp. NN258]|uniref:hypothetical protein n=1 Tax=Nonomuraea antri TaxID=2730852 RepID=UPI00156A5B73|nr:hypothetical protein [Nonomuraea antri]NRQ31602.1 hypothetical protein [Nonomuraea antri]
MIYRSWNQGILGKSVRHVAEPTVLGWVRQVWDDACAHDTYQWLIRELGTNVYGLDELFTTESPAPETVQDLRTLARTRLPEAYQCNVDEHSIRVLANGLDHDVAYYLVDDAAVAANPERWSFAVHDGPLPQAPAVHDGPSGGATAFTAPVALTELNAAGKAPAGDGTVYAVLLTCKAKHDSIGWNPTYALPGVRLPRFGAALRDLETDSGEWPLELGVLRAMVAPGEDDIAAALERCNRWPEYTWISGDEPRAPGSHTEALRLLDATPPAPERHRERTVIQTGEHVAQMFIHDGYDHFEQWFFFDDRWAAAHPDLAASLMWFAYHWDPLCSRHHLLLTPCSDNRFRYVAVIGDDGVPHVRQARPDDEPRIRDLRRWSYQKRPPGEVTPGEVLGTVEIQLHQPSPETCKFTDFRITGTRHAQAVAVALGRHVRQELRAAGITRTTGRLPEAYSHRHSPRFLRTVGRLDDGNQVLLIG